MIFDTLHTVPAGAQLGFTVVADTTALAVTITPPSGPSWPIFTNARDFVWFEPGDNLALQKIEPTLPLQFGQADGIHKIGMQWQGSSGTLYPITELAGGGPPPSRVDIPDLCGLSFLGDGIFIKTPVFAGETAFKLILTAADLSVSMVNVPDVLIDLELVAPYWLLLTHTKSMKEFA